MKIELTDAERFECIVALRLNIEEMEKRCGPLSQIVEDEPNIELFSAIELFAATTALRTLREAR